MARVRYDEHGNKTYAMSMFGVTITIDIVSENLVKLSDDDVQYVIEHPTVRLLHICTFGRRTLDFEGILNIISHSATIRNLALRFSGIRDEDIEVLVDMLIDNTNIENLDLSHNNITTLVPFARLLSLNKTIRTLFLRGNLIEKIEPLVGVLALNTSLSHLEVGNRVTDHECVDKLSRTNTSIVNFAMYVAVPLSETTDLSEVVQKWITTNALNLKNRNATLFEMMLGSLENDAPPE